MYDKESTHFPPWASEVSGYFPTLKENPASAYNQSMSQVLCVPIINIAEDTFFSQSYWSETKINAWHRTIIITEKKEQVTSSSD